MLIECTHTRFFKLHRNALIYAREQASYGYPCQLVLTQYGYSVSVFKAVA